MSFSDDKQAHAIDAFNTTSRYLDDISNTVGIINFAKPFLNFIDDTMI